MSNTQYGTTLPLDDIGAEAPLLPPSFVIRPGTIPRINTGSYETDTIGAMLLVMSATHGQNKAWHAIPYHQMYAAWRYREAQIMPMQGESLPHRMQKTLPGAKAKILQGTGFNASESSLKSMLSMILHSLIDQGLVTAADHNGEDYLAPTEMLVSSIVKNED